MPTRVGSVRRSVAQRPPQCRWPGWHSVDLHRDSDVGGLHRDSDVGDPVVRAEGHRKDDPRSVRRSVGGPGGARENLTREVADPDAGRGPCPLAPPLFLSPLPSTPLHWKVRQVADSDAGLRPVEARRRHRQAPQPVDPDHAAAVWREGKMVEQPARAHGKSLVHLSAQ